MRGARSSARISGKRAAAAADAAAAREEEPQTPPPVKKRRGPDSELAAAEWELGKYRSRAAAADAHGIKKASASMLNRALNNLKVAANTRNIPLQVLCLEVVNATRRAAGQQLTTADALTVPFVGSPGLDSLHLSQVQDDEEKKQLGVGWAIDSTRSTRDCARLLKDKEVEHGVSAATICRARGRGMPATPPSQTQAVLPARFELGVANLIRKFRSHKWPVTADHIICWVRGQVEGTNYAECFSNGGPTVGWVSKFLRRHNFVTGADPGLEKSRAQWCTSENMAKHYEATRESLLMSGIFMLNPKYDANEDYSEEIIVKPGFEHYLDAVFGYDESRVEHSMKNRGKEKQGRTVRVGQDDNGESMSDLSSFSFSLLAGSTASGKTLPVRMCMPPPLPVWEKVDEPKTGFPDVAMRVCSNEKGSISSDILVEYLKGDIKSAILDPLDITKDSEIKAVMLFDGCSSHLTPEVVDACKELGIIAQPGLPNGSHMTNREDLMAFAVFKPAYRKKQRELLMEKQVKAAVDGSRLYQAGLDKEDFLKLLKEPFEKAFTEERNRLSWGESKERGTGVYPFNKCQLVMLKQREAAAAAQLPAAAQQQPASGPARRLTVVADPSELYAATGTPLQTAIQNVLIVQQKKNEERARAARSGGGECSTQPRPLRLKAADVCFKPGGLSHPEVMAAADRVRAEKQQKAAAALDRAEKKKKARADTRAEQAALHAVVSAQLRQDQGKTLRTLELKAPQLKLLLGYFGEETTGKKAELLKRLQVAWGSARGGADGGVGGGGDGGGGGAGGDPEDKEEEEGESD